MECAFVRSGYLDTGDYYETHEIDGCQYSFAIVDNDKFPAMKDVIEIFVGLENGDCVYWDVVRGKTINEGINEWIKKITMEECC